jgi:hypothetical protein
VSCKVRKNPYQEIKREQGKKTVLQQNKIFPIWEIFCIFVKILLDYV